MEIVSGNILKSTFKEFLATHNFSDTDYEEFVSLIADFEKKHTPGYVVNNEGRKVYYRALQHEQVMKYISDFITQHSVSHKKLFEKIYKYMDDFLLIFRSCDHKHIKKDVLDKAQNYRSDELLKSFLVSLYDAQDDMWKMGKQEKISFVKKRVLSCYERKIKPFLKKSYKDKDVSVDLFSSLEAFDEDDIAVISCLDNINQKYYTYLDHYFDDCDEHSGKCSEDDILLCKQRAWDDVQSSSEFLSLSKDQNTKLYRLFFDI